MNHLDVTEFPVCYVLRLKDAPVYVPSTKYALACYKGVVEKYLKDPKSNARWFAKNLELARRWSSHKKVKTSLLNYSDVAEYYYVVGSDGSILPAERLF